VRAAVISDVHGNLAALEAVLATVDRDPPDEFWCLGDLVGYGPEPSRCIEVVRERADVCLAGNHDLVVAGALDPAVFVHDAAEAARWTAEVLDEAELAYLRSLSPAAERHGVELYHASRRDPVWEYVVSDSSAAAALHEQLRPLCLIGHSHLPLVFALVDGRVVGGMVEGDGVLQTDADRFLLNPGSVGQPRDGDPRAAYLVLDLEEGSAAWHRIEYDVAATQAAMRNAGLPLRLAARLAEGR
jgi:diadenosine tetraphosphatase ApaH/serine/threonine PP2A family protein phosphatase